MCLAIPGKVLSIDATTKTGKADFGGIQKIVSFECLPEAKIGDYVLVHVGLALSIIDAVEAERVFTFLKEMDELGELK